MIVFRVAAGTAQGMGHLSRSLVLAKQLEALGHACAFVLDSHMSSPMFQRSHTSKIRTYAIADSVPARNSTTDEVDAEATLFQIRDLEVDLFVVDNYHLGAKWETIVRDRTNCGIAAIDGRLIQRHNADFLLQPRPGVTHTTVLPSDGDTSTRVITFPPFALIDPRFFQFPETDAVSPPLRRLLVNFGGGSDQALVQKVLNALGSLSDLDLETTVILGAAYPGIESVIKSSGTMPGVSVKVDPADIHEIMFASDASIGSGGVMMWERLAARLPSLVVALSDNQLPGAEIAARAGAVEFLGMFHDIRAETIASAVTRLHSDSRYLALMRDASYKVVPVHAKSASWELAACLDQLLENQ